MSKFLRPKSLPFPQVYHTFQAKNKAGDATIEYVIKELPEERYEEALELLSTDFAPEETLCVAKNIAGNSLALNEVCFYWFKILTEQLSVGCFANDGSNELVGIAVMTVNSKDDKEEDLRPNESDTNDLLALIRYLTKENDVFSRYGVDKYLTDYAMCTKKTFRARGIATEMIRSRAAMMKALGVPVTSSAYRVIGSQKAVEKLGHKETYKVSYAELGKSFPTFDFSKANAEFLKIYDFKA